VDTYNTENGVKLAAATGENLHSIRIDSGDLLAHSRAARKLLDESGQRETRIVASGNLHEERILDLEAAAAPFDSYAVGTDLVVSADSPTLDIVYKLVEIEDGCGGWRPVHKTSKNKLTLPG